MLRIVIPERRGNEKNSSFVTNPSLTCHSKTGFLLHRTKAMILAAIHETDSVLHSLKMKAANYFSRNVPPDSSWIDFFILLSPSIFRTHSSSLSLIPSFPFSLYFSTLKYVQFKVPGVQITKCSPK